MTTCYLNKRQILPTIYAWGYVAGNLPRLIRDQKRPLDIDADQPAVTLCIPPAMRDTGHSHALVTYITDHKLYRIDWITL